MRLIHSLMARQRCGAIKEAAELQQALHRNLVYLATIADRTTTHSTATAQATQPGSTGVTTPSAGMPVQTTQPHFAPLPGANSGPPQPMVGASVNSSSQADRSLPLGVPINHPGPPTTVPIEHMSNQATAVSASQPSLPPGPQSAGPVHTQVYTSNQMSQTSSGHEITQQDASGTQALMLMNAFLI